jgi:two-component system cell cycle sensor histidine kinase/response regulator CckA
LVVDDEPLLRAVAGRTLREHGYRVLEAHGGQEALELVARVDGALDVVLIDVIMPGMDGRELARRIGELHPGLPLILMSGFTDDQGRDPESAELAPRFMAKPFSPGRLLEHVADALGRRDREPPHG